MPVLAIFIDLFLEDCSSLFSLTRLLGLSWPKIWLAFSSSSVFMVESWRKISFPSNWKGFQDRGQDSESGG